MKTEDIHTARKYCTQASPSYSPDFPSPSPGAGLRPGCLRSTHPESSITDRTALVCNVSCEDGPPKSKIDKQFFFSAEVLHTTQSLNLINTNSSLEPRPGTQHSILLHVPSRLAVEYDTSNRHSPPRMPLP